MTLVHIPLGHSPRQNCPPLTMSSRHGERGQRTPPWHCLHAPGTGRGGSNRGLGVYGLLTHMGRPFSQARVPIHEGSSCKNLTACAFSGPNWPYALVQLHKGTCHAPLPKEGHCGHHTPQKGLEATPCVANQPTGKCYQLLVTGPQVIYPIGLNGHNEEPIITSLPESAGQWHTS